MVQLRLYTGIKGYYELNNLLAGFPTSKSVRPNPQLMHGSASVKPPNGKFLNVQLDYDTRIESARLTGDFFLQPPEARTELEAAIVGHPRDVDRDTLIEAIDTVDATLIGFDADDLATATLDALEETA